MIRLKPVMASGRQPPFGGCTTGLLQDLLPEHGAAHFRVQLVVGEAHVCVDFLRCGVAFQHFQCELATAFDQCQLLCFGQDTFGQTLTPEAGTDDDIMNVQDGFAGEG